MSGSNIEVLLCMPLLKGKTKQGKIVYWKGDIVKNKDLIMTRVSFGYSLETLQYSFTEYLHGKNIGKKNETTPMEQATKELQRKWKDKKEKNGYVEFTSSGERSSTLYPMLCSSYKKWKKEYNGYMVQPKLDGVRCVIHIDDNITFQSRNGKSFVIEHLLNELSFIQSKREGKPIVLDGELYSREIPFEELVGLIRKSTNNNKELNKNIEKIHFYCFDVIEEYPFEKRLLYLKRLFSNRKTESKIHLVNTEYITDETMMISFYHKMMNDNYEGIILRNPRGKYVCKYRSKDVIKYKEMRENEYKIVGYESGTGKDKDTMIWICEIPDTKQQFKVRPRGSYSYRKELYKNGEKYIGKDLTVIYQELTKHNIPRFPVGKCIREGE